MDDLIRCYADIFYLKTTLHLPPQPVDLDPYGELGLPAPTPTPRRTLERTLSALLRLGGLVAKGLRRQLERTATAAPLAGKRNFRRLGG
jgi:hypothetical protein